MRTLKMVLACCLLATTANAQPGTGSGSGAPPTAPGGTTMDPSATPAEGMSPTDAAAQPTPPPPPAEPPPPPPPVETPPPPPVVTPPPPPPQAVVTAAATPAAPEKPPERPSPPRCAGGSSSYYNCERPYGIFHNSRLVVGGLSGETSTTTTDPATGTMTTEVGPHTTGVLAFEAAFLGVPSSFAPTNFHGIEVSSGIRLSKFDFWLSFGTAVTFLNLGHGGPGTLRIGGSFGAGFNLAHGYGYIRGRAAAVILPERLDVEVSAQWTPPSASTSDYDEQNYRLSAWYRINERSNNAVELYLETFSRVDRDPMTTGDREIVDGAGAGLGFSFF